MSTSERSEAPTWPDLPWVPSGVPLPGVGVRIEAERGGELGRLPSGYLRRRVLGERLVVLRGLPVLAPDELVAFARAFEPGGALLEWPTGPIMDVAVDDTAVNYLFSRERVPLHWDGFFDREPSYLVWQCVVAPRRGGATLFVDAARVWELAGEVLQRAWGRIELTYATERRAHYGGVITLPLVARHPVTGRPTLRYAEPVATALNPLAVSCPELSDGALTELVRDLEARLYDPRVCHEHVWQDGDLVIADNRALLHGRTAIEGGGPRHLRRVQIL